MSYYEPSEFDEKVEEFKDYLRESVKKETLDQIDRLTKENKRLKDNISALKKENKELEDRNKLSITSDIITSLIVNNIGTHNIYRIIEILFPKTFDERLTGDCPLFWLTYVNYYDNRKDVIALLRFAGIKVPDELDDIILPHEWNEELLDKFFDTMYAHYNCNGTMYEDNLQFWDYKMAAHPFDTNYFSCYDEVPWQFVLRNPLLNSQKYAVKIAQEMNKGQHGLFFSNICEYQELSQETLQAIVDNLDMTNMTNKKALVDFLIAHIELVKDEKKLNKLYSVIESKYRGEDYILQMPKKYQMKYAKSLNDINKRFNFLQKAKFSKEEKIEIINNLFEDI